MVNTVEVVAEMLTRNKYRFESCPDYILVFDTALPLGLAMPKQNTREV